MFQANQEQNSQSIRLFSKQVYVEEVDEEHQKSFKAIANHVNTFHIQEENLSLTKKKVFKTNFADRICQCEHQIKVKSVL